MLLYIDNSIVEIRPGELFESKVPIDSRFLDLLEEPVKKKYKIKGEELCQQPLLE
jgi:hypothetical protein